MHIIMSVWNSLAVLDHLLKNSSLLCFACKIIFQTENCIYMQEGKPNIFRSITKDISGCKATY